MKIFCAKSTATFLSLVSLILTSSLFAEGLDLDFAAADRSLQIQQERIYELTAQYGRYDQNLVVPLQQFARSQMEINRYDDAADTVDYAIQIVRTEHGLETPQQYDLQQMAVEVDLYRQDWERINERLDYYSGLILSAYSGTVEDRIQRLLWLADVHVRGALEDEAALQASHLVHATWFNETAVVYAQSNHADNNRLYADMLYALVNKYHLEARGILAGGATGYRLRQKQLGLPEADGKTEALDKRYRAGLDKLVMLRNLFAHSPNFGEEAVGMMQLYMADWKALFDKSDDLSADYATGLETLARAGVPAARLDEFLSSPMIIPRSNLELSVNEALTLARQDNAFDSVETTLPEIRLLEPAAHIAGFVQNLDLVDWQGGISSDWSRLSVTLTVDPDTHIRVRNGAFRTRSRVTGENLVVLSSEADHDVTRKALRRIQTLSFRPAFDDGQAVASELAVDYMVRSSSQRSITPLITEQWVASYPAPGRISSLAATGE